MFGFETRILKKLSPGERRDVESLLSASDLSFEEGAELTAVAVDDAGTIKATASLFGDVVRMVAVSREERDGGLSGLVVSALINAARDRGISRLFAYAKAESASLFIHLGFAVLAETAEVALLEIGAPGADSYREYLQRERLPGDEGECGAIVMNANPFSRGHRHLIERGAELCRRLYVIVVEAERSQFKFKDRLEMVRLGCQDIPCVRVIKSNAYAVSNATFPTYFLKDKGRESVAEIQARLDVDLFLRLFVPSLGLTVRFIGTEELCDTTSAYNSAMLEMLPCRGVNVQVIPRLRADDGELISASCVRRKLSTGDTDDLDRYLPPTTLRYLSAMGLLNS